MEYTEIIVSFYAPEDNYARIFKKSKMLTIDYL